MSASPVFASAAGASGGTGAFLIQMAPLVLIFVIFWFLLIRPQQKRMKEHRAMIGAVKRGDRVVTGGGLLGKVIKVQDNEVEIELAQGVRVRALKSTLSEVIVPEASAAND